MATETLPHVHHWILEAAAGPSSPGVCRLCQEKKDFLNYVEPTAWASRGNGNRGGGGRPGPAAAE